MKRSGEEERSYGGEGLIIHLLCLFNQLAPREKCRKLNIQEGQYLLEQQFDAVLGLGTFHDCLMESRVPSPEITNELP